MTVTTTTSGPWEKYNHNNLMQFMQIKKYNIWLQWLKQLTWW